LGAPSITRRGKKEKLPELDKKKKKKKPLFQKPGHGTRKMGEKDEDIEGTGRKGLF